MFIVTSLLLANPKTKSILVGKVLFFYTSTHFCTTHCHTNQNRNLSDF